MGLNEVLSTVLIALSGVLTAVLPVVARFVIAWIKAKTDEIAEKAENERLTFYLDELNELVEEVVLATKGLYVDRLKDEGAFTLEAQQEILEKAKKMVFSLSSKKMQNVLDSFEIDLSEYVEVKLEAFIELLSMSQSQPQVVEFIE